MDAPDDYWQDAVDIEDTTPLDYENRNTTLNIYDPHRTYRVAIEHLSNEFDLPVSGFCDLAVRIYLAYLSDTREDIDVHSRAPQSRLVPPSGWVAQQNPRINDLPIIHDQSEDSAQRQFSFQTTDTVHEMMAVVIDSSDEWENFDEFSKDAISFVGDGYEERANRIDERPSTAVASDLTHHLEEEAESEQQPLLELVETENRRDLLEYFMSESIPDRGYNKADLSEASGVTSGGIRRHIDPFLEADIIRRTTSKDAHIKRYTTNDDSDVLRALRIANNILK
jgi:hypothetical protein